MKLSDIVAKLNLLDSLDVASECAQPLAHKSHNTCGHEHAGTISNCQLDDILKTHDELLKHCKIFCTS
jgi:hypothetical protein